MQALDTGHSHSCQCQHVGLDEGPSGCCFVVCDRYHTADLTLVWWEIVWSFPTFREGIGVSPITWYGGREVSACQGPRAHSIPSVLRAFLGGRPFQCSVALQLPQRESLGLYLQHTLVFQLSISHPAQGLPRREGTCLPRKDYCRSKI